MWPCVPMKKRWVPTQLTFIYNKLTLMEWLEFHFFIFALSNRAIDYLVVQCQLNCFIYTANVALDQIFLTNVRRLSIVMMCVTTNFLIMNYHLSSSVGYLQNFLIYDSGTTNYIVSFTD